MIIIIATQTSEDLEEVVEVLAKIKQELKKNPVAKEICSEHGFDIDIIDGIPMEFIDDLEASAKTIDSRIQLSTGLLDEDFEIMMRYAIHELVHSLQHMRSEGINPNDGREYLDREDELEAFQYQIEYDAETRGEEEAEEYVEDLIEYHEVPEEEREEKKEELLEKAASKLKVQWSKPSLREEDEELERTAEDEDLDYNQIKKALQQGQMIPLSEEIWSQLKNTDSYSITDLNDAKKMASSYDRDIERIIYGINSGKKMPAPIILQANGQEILIAGNTRLMVCKALNIKPEIWHGVYQGE